MPTHARVTRSCERAFGVGAPSRLQVVVDERDLARATAALERDPGIAGPSRPPQRAGGRALLSAVPTDGSRAAAELRSTIDAVRAELPASALVGGPAAENRDLEQALVSRLPLVVGVIMGLGFLLLVVAAARAARSRRRRRAQPARDRGGVRRRAAGLPGRRARGGAGLRVAGIRGRVGADLLLRPRVRAGDGLHRLPAGHGQGGATTAPVTPRACGGRGPGRDWAV